MAPLRRVFDDHALELLDQFLMSDRSPDDTLSISELDGLLTAVAAGPELVMPSEWLSAVWGGGKPKFANMDEANAVLGAMMARYNQIIRELELNELAPLFWTGPDRQVIAADWCEGFMDGVLLRIDAWEPLFADEHGQSMLFPIMALCSDEHGDDLLELDPDEQEEVAEKAPELIPDCAWAIHRFWRKRRLIRSGSIRSVRIRGGPSDADG